MKKLICAAMSAQLLLSSVLPCWSQNAEVAPSSHKASQCSMQGREDNRQRTSTGGAYAVGVVSGLALGLVGTAVAWAGQGTPQPPAESLAALDNAECRALYATEYGKAGKAKKRSSALTGGLIGTAIIVGLIAASSSQSQTN